MVKENATNSSEIHGQCFANECTNVHQAAISFQQYEFSFTPAGSPATLGVQTPGLSPSVHSIHTFDPPLRKEKALYCMPKHMPSYQGVSFSQGSLRKHLKSARLLEMLLAVICNLTLFTAAPKTCCHSLGLNLAS